MTFAPKSEITYLVSPVYCPQHPEGCRYEFQNSELVDHHSYTDQATEVIRSAMTTMPVNSDLADDLDDFTVTLIRKLEAAFGAELTLDSQLGKLDEEVQEIHEVVNDDEGPDRFLEELADAVVVCCTAARVQGFTVTELLSAVWAKSYRNTQREWGVGDGRVARHTKEA